MGYHGLSDAKPATSLKPTLSDFITQWAVSIVALLEWELLEKVHYTLTCFLQSLRKYDGSERFPQLSLGSGASQPPFSPLQKKSKPHHHVAAVPEILSHLLSQENLGWTIAYTDGSSGVLPGGTRVGHIPALSLEFASPLPYLEA